MISDTPSVSQLSHVISQAAASAFLLGALAAFIAVLISRLNRVVDRTIVLNGIPDDDTARCRLKADLPRVMRRAVVALGAFTYHLLILANRIERVRSLRLTR